MRTPGESSRQMKQSVLLRWICLPSVTATKSSWWAKAVGEGKSQAGVQMTSSSGGTFAEREGTSGESVTWADPSV